LRDVQQCALPNGYRLRARGSHWRMSLLETRSSQGLW
jgi:hypothetical protein